MAPSSFSLIRPSPSCIALRVDEPVARLISDPTSPLGGSNRSMSSVPPANNFQYVDPYNWDYFQGTDRWYELSWNPDLGQWTVYVNNSFLDQFPEWRLCISQT